MKRILHGLGSLEQGGSETYTLRYINFDKENEHFVICGQGKTGVLEEEFKKRSRIITDIYFGRIFGNYIKFYKFLKKEKIDVYWQGGIAGGSAISLLVAQLAGVKRRIIFYRSSSWYWEERDFFHLKELYIKIVDKICSKSVNTILANSYSAINNYHPNLPANKYKVIYNGINKESISKKTKKEIRELLNIPNDAFVVGHSGRLNSAKNHKMIVKVALNLCHKYTNMYFVLMGLNVDKEYRDLIKSEGLEKQILLLGYRNDVMDILKGLDLYYFPSITEGQPNALLEAMVSGLPFVASNIEPIQECIPDNLVRFLVDPYDEGKNISAIESLYNNPEILHERSCEEWALKRFDAEVQFQLFKEELEK